MTHRHVGLREVTHDPERRIPATIRTLGPNHGMFAWERPTTRPPDPYAACSATSGRRPAARPWHRRRRLPVQPDHAVGPATPPVDHARHARLGVHEQEEVVPDQLHLVERLVQAHRHGRVGLLPDHDRAVALVPTAFGRAGSRLGSGSRSRSASDLSDDVRRGRRDCGGRGRSRSGLGLVDRYGAGCHLGEPLRGPSTAVDPLAVAHPAQPLEQLAHRHVQCCVRVVGTGLGAHDRSPVQAGDLYPVAGLGLPAVGLMRDHDVQALHPRRQLRDLGQLFLEMPAKALGHLGVPTSDDDLHDDPPWSR